MYDKEVILDTLEKLLNAIRTIQCRFDGITTPNDFVSTPEGMKTFDAICMQFIVIGEALKNLDKLTARALLSKHPEVNWKGAKAMRDIICHEYFDVDIDAIFLACREDLRPLAKAIEKMKMEI